MKPFTKKLIFGGLVAAGVLSYLGYKKGLKIQAILNEMEIKPAGISKVKIWWEQNRLTFNLDIRIINPTNGDLYITSGGLAVVKKIIIFYQGKQLGAANVNISNIEVPAENELLLKNIEVEGTIANALQAASLYTGINLNDLSIKAIVELAGKQFEISQ